MFGNGFVEILAAQQTNEGSHWYQGTADAIRQNYRQIIQDPCQDCIILAGDQLYRMDFGEMLTTHHKSDADVTLAVLPVGSDTVGGLGIVRTNEEGRIVGFVEKPQTAEQLKPFYVESDWIEKRGIRCNGRNYLASMGIYIFKKQALLEMLDTKPLATDFGKEIFPRDYPTRRINVHLFDGYWEDVGTIKSYHEASLALASEKPPFDFHSAQGIIFTRMRFLPPSRIMEAELKSCMISDGSVILPGAKIEHSLLGVRSRVGRNAIIKDSVIIGSDRFESDAEREVNRRKGIPDFNIGDGAIIHRAILDKDCRIGRNVKILNEKEIMEFDSELYSIRDGIVVVPRGSIIPDGTVI
jgi:glucose-1-phosphate adenylyltransferase